MEPKVKWPESLYDRCMRARIAITDVFTHAVDREVEAEVRESVHARERSPPRLSSPTSEQGLARTSSLGPELFGRTNSLNAFSRSKERGSMMSLRSAEAPSHDAVCAALKAVEFDVVKIVQTLADSLPSFQQSDDDEEPSLSMRRGTTGSATEEDMAAKVRFLEQRLKNAQAKSFDFRAKCSHLEFQIEALKAHCNRKDGVVEYIRQTLFQEVVVLREQLHRQNTNPNFQSDFVSLFDYTKLLEGSTPNTSHASQEAFKILKKEHASELTKVHSAHAAAMRAKQDEIEEIKQQLLERVESAAKLRRDSTLPAGKEEEEAGYRQQFRVLQDELSSKEATIETMKHEMAALKEEIKNQQHIARGFKDQLTRTNDEVEDIIEVKNREIVNKVQLVADLEAKCQTMDTIKTQLQLSTAKNEKLSVEVFEMSNKIQDLEAALPKAEAERDDLSKRNEKLKATIERLETSGSDQVARQERVMQGEISKLEEKLQTTQAELKDAKVKVDFQASELSHAQFELRTVSQEAQKLREHVERLRQNIGITEDDFSDVTVLAEDRDRTIQRLQQRVVVKVAEHEALQATNSELGETIEALRNELEETKSSMKASPNSPEEEGGPSTRLKEDLTVALHENRLMSDENDELRKQVATLASEAGEFKDCISGLQHEIDLLRAGEAVTPTDTTMKTYAFDTSKRPPSAGRSRRASGAGVAPEQLDRRVSKDSSAFSTNAAITSPTAPETISDGKKKKGTKPSKSPGKGRKQSTVPKSTRESLSDAASLESSVLGASANPAANDALMKRIASITAAKAEADSQVKLLASQVTKLKEQLAAASQGGKKGAATPTAAKSSPSKRPTATHSAKQATEESSTPATPPPLPLHDETGPLQPPPPPPPPQLEDLHHLSTEEVQSRVNAAVDEAREHERSKCAAELRELRQTVERLSSQSKSNTSPLASGLADRCSVACSISGTQYPKFSKAIKESATAFGAAGITSRQDRGRVMLTGTFSKVSDGFSWGRDILKKAITDYKNNQELVKVQVGATHGPCASENGEFFGPTPTRAQALALVATPNTLILSEEADAKLSLEGGTSSNKDEVSTKAVLRCATDDEPEISVKCTAMTNEYCAVKPADLVPDTSTDEKAVWDPLPLFSASARLQHDFYQQVAEKRRRPTQIIIATPDPEDEDDVHEFSLSASMVAEETVAPEPVQQAPKQHDARVPSPVTTVISQKDTATTARAEPKPTSPTRKKKKMRSRFIQCSLLTPEMVHLAGHRRSTASEESRSREDSMERSVTRVREWVAEKLTPRSSKRNEVVVQAGPTHDIKSTQTNVTTDPESLFANVSPGRANTPIGMIHEQLMELHHSPTAMVRRGFNAQRRLAKEARGGAPTAHEQEPSFFVGDIPDFNASRPASALGLSHHQQGGKPRRRVGSAMSHRSMDSSKRVADQLSASAQTQLDANVSEAAAPPAPKLVEGLADRSKIMAFNGEGAEMAQNMILESVASWSRYPIAMQTPTPNAQQPPKSPSELLLDDEGNPLDEEYTNDELSEAPSTSHLGSSSSVVATSKLEVPKQWRGDTIKRDGGDSQRPPTPSTIDNRKHMSDVYLGGGRGAAVRGVKEKLQQSVDVAAFIKMYGGEDHFKATTTNPSPNTTPYVDTRPRKKPLGKASKNGKNANLPKVGK